MIVVHGRGPCTPASVQCDRVPAVTPCLASIDDGTLTVGSWCVDLLETPLWDPEPLLARWPQTGSEFVAIAAVAHAQARVGARIDRLCDAIRSGIPAANKSAVDAGIDDAADDDAIDGAAIDDALRALVGFGPGLTPSGDDALVGLLAALYHSPGPAQGWRVALGHAVPALLHRTSDVSAHYLSLAVDGHFGEAVLEAAEHVFARCAEPHRLRLLGFGATSGADTLAGLLSGVRLVNDVRGARRTPAGVGAA
jgi:hypothetical protein